MATPLASPSRALARTLYRGLVRAATKADAAGASAADVRALWARAPPGGAPGAFARAAVRAAFRMEGGSVTEALQVLPKASALASSLQSSPAAAPAPAAAPLFRPGHVFRHAKHGYRAAIVGWDEVCRAAPEWVTGTGAAALPHGTAQPFYYALVDARDRPGAQVAYVAQDLVHLLSSSAPEAAAAAAAVPAPGGGLLPADAGMQLMQQLLLHQQQHQLAERLVCHPLTAAHFQAFNPLQGVFVPRMRMSEEADGDGAEPAATLVGGA